MDQDKDREISRVIELIVRQHHRILTDSEEKELDDWAGLRPENRRLLAELASHAYQRTSFEQMDRYDEPAALQHLMERLAMPSATVAEKRRRWPVWAAAAAVAALAGAIWLTRLAPLHTGTGTREIAVAEQVGDAPPGAARAVLTLAGGRTIALDSAHVGQLALQGTSRIVKLTSGVLAYQTGGQPVSQEVQYNTLSTPRGGEYQLGLPDGTRVWLNAASSIRFPTSFTGSERRVVVTGEAYFEVAPNTAMPFIVEKGDMQVSVLGTHFDVDAYDDESDIRVTLLEGAVKVSREGAPQTTTLRPGEQVRVDRTGQMNLVRNVDVNRVVAWKDGRFAFSGNIQQIMREIARWYNVQVTYEGDVTDKDFEGTISKYEYVSHVLEMLEMTGSIHFEVRDAPGSTRVDEIVVKP